MSDENDDLQVPEWTVTYGDMMSLILCFFIMLYAVSSIQETKFQSTTESLRGSFGLFGNAASNYNQPPKARAVAKSAGRKIGGTILFDSGSGELSESAKRELNAVHRQMLDSPFTVQIIAKSGTAESSAYRRGLDLAYLRGTAVWDYLVSLGMNRDQCQMTQQTGENEGAIVEVRIGN
jgi:flagellar motor protein MotB